ncbi:hypothetical protein GB937_010754 [Aspergillus fischeri]|nr:hypothetical protein GB937_010754 [Aspergillus fischeri]
MRLEDIIYKIGTNNTISLPVFIGDSSVRHWAAQKGYFYVTETLLRHEEDLNVRDEYDRTPVFHAIPGNNEMVMKVLLEQKLNDIAC